MEGQTLRLQRTVLASLCVVASSLLAAGPVRTLTRAEKVDPTSIQVSVKMDSIPAIGVPNVVKVGSGFTLSCAWDVKFVKATTLHGPIPLDVRITDLFNGSITVLKSESTSVKVGDYKNPGMQVVGGIIAPWKPAGFGKHELTCQAGVTAAEWWVPGKIQIVQKKWTVLVDPDTYKTCLPIYLVSVTKSPKMNPTDGAAPVDLVLTLDHTGGGGSADEMMCHYRSKSGDLPDFPVAVPCPGATLLPPIPGQIMPPRFYCKP
jgi:hypothetical protein